jgi:tartrate-resistant acid phosphatase type 5
MRDHDENLARLIEDGLAGRMSRRELMRRGLALGLGLPAIAGALAACGLEPPATASAPLSRWRPATPAPLSATFQPVPTLAPTPAPTAVPTAPPAARFAVIGDFGLEGEPAAAVAALVASWAPDFVVSTGDNNYPDGLAETIDRNVGQYYSAYIGDYRGAFGPGAAENRFWPVLGNHDWVVGYPEPYLSYFALPGNGRYYAVERGPVALFALDSMPGEPDGIDAGSPQGAWLQAALAASSAPWKIVVLHHSPYSSGYHGSSEWMRWPFAAWGARLVLGGHDHTYERVEADGITYVVNGLGGGARYAPGFVAVEGSRVFFNADHGAVLVEADAGALRARFVTRAEQVVDEFRL